MKTLAIETSCDDTSVAIVNNEGNIFSVEKILAYSQIEEHQVYGGVVPEIASRLHAEKIVSVLENIGREEIKKVDFISVTTHPGLPGSLVVGKAAAHMLGEYFDKKVVEVNHIHGHIFSVFLERSFQDIQFPLAVLTVSGGHNDIYIVCKEESPTREVLQGEGILSSHHLAGYDIYKVGASIDDAAGECYDKVARMLDGPYPGGFWIDTLAKEYINHP
jgi:N6-L-threonylcarbamoyladenine synthase